MVEAQDVGELSMCACVCVRGCGHVCRAQKKVPKQEPSPEKQVYECRQLQ